MKKNFAGIASRVVSRGTGKRRLFTAGSCLFVVLGRVRTKREYPRCRRRLEYHCSILKKHTRRQQLRTGYGKTMVSGWRTNTCDFRANALSPPLCSRRFISTPLINRRTTTSQLYDSSFVEFFLFQLLSS